MKLYLTIIFLFASIIAHAQGNPRDCENAIIICGDSSLGIEPNGIGFDEFSLPGNYPPNCYTFDHHRLWFKFEFVTSGTFTFDLIPDNGLDDYDFAIFGPNVDCTNLGHAIRCSSTNPQQAGVPADTGLNMTETDTEEGPGEDGNGYLKYIDALAGEVYYLLVDRAEGSGPLSIFYTGTAALPNPVEANRPNNLLQCDTDGVFDGQTDFNLESQTAIIKGSQTDVTVTYHESLNDASIGDNPLPNPYRNTSNPQTIYTRVTSDSGCFDITTFELEIGNPELMQPEDVILCSHSSSEEYLLDNIIPEVIADPQGYVFSYYDSEEDANNNRAPLGTTVVFTETPRTVFVRVSSQANPDCFSVTSFQGYTIFFEPAGRPSDVIACDDDFDEKIRIDLNEKSVEILDGRAPVDFEILYFASEEDRDNRSNPLSGIFQNTQNPQTIYVSFTAIASECTDFTQFSIRVNPLPVPVFEQDGYIYCLNATEKLPISVQSGFRYYRWDTGEEGRNTNTIYVDSPGTYSVTVTNGYGCSNSVSTVVTASNIATITLVEVHDFNGKNNSVMVMVEGPGDYEFAIDNYFQFQDENFFTGLSNGYHTVHVRDKNGCGVISQEFLVLDYPRYFTPNNDGYHDFWHIVGLNEFPKAQVRIYDRFGKFLKQVSPISKGWDGKDSNGTKMPSSDYWFTIQIENRPKYRGHFTLKR